MTTFLTGVPTALWSRSRRFLPVLGLSIVLYAVLALTQPGFDSTANLKNLLTAVSVLFITAIGMTFVVVTAGADLSVAAIGSLAGIFFAKIVAAGVPGWPAVLVTLLFGTLVGAVVNGVFVGLFGLSFFVVTLASMTALTGVVNLWSGTQSFVVDTPVATQIGVDEYAGLPAPIWIMIGIFLVALYVQRSTFFGRDVYAVGGSLTAARLSGIRTTRTYVVVYGLSALCATIGGLVTIGRVGVAAPNVDATLPLSAIAAVLLGGTALSGGSGGVGGTVIGVLFIGILQNGLSIAGVPSFWQQVVTGAILMLAVLGDRASVARLCRALSSFSRQTETHPTATPTERSNA
ncbi:ABC transporter permease [Amycolatopsis sp. GM8]|uniref:ABC transporter permease n=1 Tax=Amycolatopsis sp. GM8 TaxID=2896530 RepID=UPI001F256F21|nr:ABC transporter permease [Amycolatopsis sp. GM8]